MERENMKPTDEQWNETLDEMLTILIVNIIPDEVQKITFDEMTISDVKKKLSRIELPTITVKYTDDKFEISDEGDVACSILRKARMNMYTRDTATLPILIFDEFACKSKTVEIRDTRKDVLTTYIRVKKVLSSIVFTTYNISTKEKPLVLQPIAVPLRVAELLYTFGALLGFVSNRLALGHEFKTTSYVNKHRNKKIPMFELGTDGIWRPMTLLDAVERIGEYVMILTLNEYAVNVVSNNRKIIKQTTKKHDTKNTYTKESENKKPEDNQYKRRSIKLDGVTICYSNDTQFHIPRHHKKCDYQIPVRSFVRHIKQEDGTIKEVLIESYVRNKNKPPKPQGNIYKL